MAKGKRSNKRASAPGKENAGARARPEERTTADATDADDKQGGAAQADEGVHAAQAWYRDKQTIALVTGFVSTGLTIVNMLVGTIGRL